MWNKIGSALYERIVKAYKSTFLGIAIEAGIVVVDTVQAADVPAWAHAVAGVASTLLILYRGKKQPAALPGLTPVP